MQSEILKIGCEFNTYVRSGVLSVDAVVNSQDPDTMSSFLGFYVAEMHRRQVLFNTTAEQCGRIIRKYETYREACSDHGLPHVPRICLIIDEFQSLFDSPVAGTSALLSELVRKGRTFGIHIIMASQRAYRIIRATVSHLNSKITLQREWYFDALSKPLGLCFLNVAPTLDERILEFQELRC